MHILLSPAAQAAMTLLPDAHGAPDWPQPEEHEAWQTLRRELESAVEPLNAGTVERNGCTSRETTLGDMPAICVTPANARPGAILYAHGGGYVLHSVRSTLFCAARLAAATNIKVVSLDYPLAPEADCHEAVASTVTAARALATELGDWKQLALAGDSAGGGLMTAVVHRLLEGGDECPASLILGSPWVDLTDASTTIQTLATHDRQLRFRGQLDRAAAAYAKDAMLHPDASPIYGAFDARFPQTLIVAGTKEILLGDAARLARAIRLGGSRCHIEVFDGMPHVFHLLLAATDAPEADEVYGLMAGFIHDRISA